jgi:hypothetical protein
MEVDMTTLPRGALVSAAFALSAALGACAPTTARLEPSPSVEIPVRTIRFANDAGDYVHVYLIGERRQWLLGRVEQGAVATLRLPDDAVTKGADFMQLAVLTGERVTLQAARAPRARLTMAQPAHTIASQQWRFAQGELTGLLR